MENKSEIFDFKLIFRWLIIITGFFLAGYALKNLLGYFTIIFFLFFYITKKYENQVYLLLIWLFISEYFSGIRIMDNEGPIPTSGFTLLSLFIIFIQSKNFHLIVKNRLVKSLLIIHFLLFIFLLIAHLLNGGTFLRIIRFFNYFLIFLVLILGNFKKDFYIKIINLIFAVGFFQIPIAFAQYMQIVPAPFIASSNSDVYLEQQLNLDDAACGTFGSASSPDLSLFLTFLSTIMLIQYFRTKGIKYLISFFLLLLQYVIVDSKTVLGVSIFFLLILFLTSSQLRMMFVKVVNIKILILFVIFAFGFYTALTNYYKKGFEAGGKSQYELTKNRVEGSVSLLKKNFFEWGKLTGFGHVLKLQRKRGDVLNNFFGIGVGEVNFRYEIKKKTSIKFYVNKYANHFLDTSSTLITLLAQLGIAGVCGIFLVYGLIFHYFSFVPSENQFSQSIRYILKSFVISCLLYAFINKEMTLNDHTLITLWIFLGIVYKLEEVEDNNSTSHNLLT